MRKFTKNILLICMALLGCISLIVLFDYFVIGSQYKQNYQASLIDKVNRLESIDEPKIILVGNSNLAFGIHSDEIQEKIGMPVVNLGLHGGLGNAYHEQISKLNINEGDIVVVCHSSFCDDDTISDPALAWITYDWNNNLWNVLRKKDYKTMILAYPDYLKSVLLLWVTHSGNKDVDSCYSRSAFNEYGDVVYKPVVGQINVDTYFSENPISVPEINDICIKRLNEFNQYCLERDASLVVAGYPIAYGKYAEFSEYDFENFQVELEKNLDCNVISDYTDYFYPYEFFYDTTLHMTDYGAEVRTKQLISDLQKWLNKEPVQRSVK